MKARMLAHLQTDGSVHLIPAGDVPTVVQSIVNNATVGTNLQFTVVETEMNKLEKAPRVGNAYHLKRTRHGDDMDDGFITGDGLLDLILLMELLDDGGYDYAPEWDEPVMETTEDITPVMESCGTTEDTTPEPSTPSYEPSPSFDDDSTRSSGYSSSSFSDDSSSSYDSGSSDCGGGSFD